MVDVTKRLRGRNVRDLSKIGIQDQGRASNNLPLDPTLKN
jgi:hypothetical protein